MKLSIMDLFEEVANIIDNTRTVVSNKAKNNK